MRIKQKSGEKVLTLPVGIGAGVAIGCVTTVILSAIMAWMIGYEKITEDSVDIGAAIIQLLSSGTGAWTAYVLTKSRRLLVCLVTGCGYCMLLLACTALFHGGQYQSVGTAILVTLAGGLLVGLAGLRGNKRNNIRRRKISNR